MQQRKALQYIFERITYSFFSHLELELMYSVTDLQMDVPRGWRRANHDEFEGRGGHGYSTLQNAGEDEIITLLTDIQYMGIYT